MRLRVASVLLLGVVMGGCASGGKSDDALAGANRVHRQQLDRVLHRLQRRLVDEKRQARRKAARAGEPASARGSASAVVAIDPGHNGGNGAHPEIINKPVVAYADGRTKACDTTGTETNDGVLTEAQFNLEIAKLLAARLRAGGLRVVMTRTTNDGVGPCINQRAAIGNRAGAAAAISIHADGNEATGAHGFDVIYPASDELIHPTIAGPSRRLAIAVRDALARTGVPPANYVGSNGLDARDDLGGLNLSAVPKVFVELGNMRSASEAAKLETSAYRARLAAALAAGLKRFLGVR